MRLASRTRAEITHSTLIGKRQPAHRLRNIWCREPLFYLQKGKSCEKSGFESSFKKLEGFTKPVALISLWTQWAGDKSLFFRKGMESPVHHSHHHSISSITPYCLPLLFVLSVTSLLAFESCWVLCVCVCVCVFWPGSSQDLSSQTRDRNHAPCSESWSPNNWTTREVPDIWVLTSDLDADTLDFLWKNRERKKKAKSRMRKQRS